MATKEQSPSGGVVGNQQLQQQQPFTNGNVEEKITEFQRNITSTIAPGVKRKAVVLERPNIGALFSSDEINFLVYRYLVENGYQHTAWTFGSESNVHNAQIDNNQVPKGALIRVLQKGVFFAEAELYSLMDGEAIEKYEKTTGTVSLIESANPPARKKICPVIDQRAIEKSVTRLNQHRKDLFTRELQMIRQKQQEEVSKHPADKPLPRNEKDTATQMANKNILKTMREKEHDREKDTKDQDKREKAMAAVTTGHLSNGINAPAHHRTKLENKRMHSATPPSTSTSAAAMSIPISGTPHQQQNMMLLMQIQAQQAQQQQQAAQLQQQQQQPQTNIPQMPPPPQQQTIQQQQQQQQPQTNHQSHSHSSTPAISINNQKDQQQQQQQQLPPTTIQQQYQLQQQQQQQARGTPQPQPSLAGQSSSAIGVAPNAQQQQQPTAQQLAQLVQNPANWQFAQLMQSMQNGGHLALNPAAYALGGGATNGFDINFLKSLQAGQQPGGVPPQTGSVYNSKHY